MLACMTILIGLWHRLTLWVCLSLFLLTGVARPDHGLGSISQNRRDLCQGLCQWPVGHLCLRGLTWRVGMRLIWVARSLLVAVSPPVLLRLGERGHGGQHSWCVRVLSFFSLLIIFICSFSGWYTFQMFWSMEKHYIQQVLNMVWSHHLQLRSHPPLFSNFGDLMSRWWQLIILLFRGRLMSFL